MSSLRDALTISEWSFQFISEFPPTNSLYSEWRIGKTCLTTDTSVCLLIPQRGNYCFYTVTHKMRAAYMDIERTHVIVEGQVSELPWTDTFSAYGHSVPC